MRSGRTAFYEARRAANLVSAYVDYRRARLVCHALPTRADVEPTNRCNFRCTMCQTAIWQRKRQDMTLDQFEYVLDSIPTLYSLKLVGMGEPLLNPAFFDMVRLAARRGIRVKTTTNGSLLDNEARREILQCGLARVDISLDGVTAATHEALRPGADFDRIVSNVEELMRQRGPSRLPEVRLWGVAQSGNAHELPSLPELGRRLGVDKAGYQGHLTNFGSREMEARLSERRVRISGDRRVDIKTASGLPSLAVTAEPEPHSEAKSLAQAERKLCRWPWERVFISCEGHVCPCCIVSDPQIINLGNLFENSFRKIWRGTAYQQLRQGLVQGPVPDCCSVACGLE